VDTQLVNTLLLVGKALLVVALVDKILQAPPTILEVTDTLQVAEEVPTNGIPQVKLLALVEVLVYQ
jgi:hypothetical protein